MKIGVQILHTFERERKKKDKDGVLFPQSRSENYFLHFPLPKLSGGDNYPS